MDPDICPLLGLSEFWKCALQLHTLLNAQTVQQGCLSSLVDEHIWLKLQMALFFILHQISENIEAQMRPL